ncbi:MAG: hypothetical protein K6C08_15145, partial [Oscillospiraceae bacterium]|nr:hypothetical protein [Oscillospiraceae bacterium]
IAPFFRKTHKFSTIQGQFRGFMLSLKACFFQKLLDRPFRMSIDRFIQRFPCSQFFPGKADVSLFC